MKIWAKLRNKLQPQKKNRKKHYFSGLKTPEK
jgi:hypothetical protein